MVLARELTKLHEQVLRGTARAVRESLHTEQRRGEIVLVLGGRVRTKALSARPESGRGMSGRPGSGHRAPTPHDGEPDA